VRCLAIAAVLTSACGSAGAPTTPPKPESTAVATREKSAEEEQAEHDQIVASHRKIEEEQQDALASTCDEKGVHDDHQRCLPTCYATEPADPRAGKKLAGATVIDHVVCEPPEGSTGPYVVADELERTKLTLRPVRGRAPSLHKKGTWQADVEASLAENAHPKPARGEVFVVASKWRELTHPLTGAHLRCVTVSQVVRSSRRALDGCGSDGALGCEATGDAAARGLNVVHYRLAEARRLQDAGKADDCQQAALEAIAVARGLPRWRQYAKLNVGHWTEHAGYRTRFDGVLDEDTLFATAATLGGDAEAVYAACGGSAGAHTTAAQEQSFHTCW
jgi:hypothetical protein